MARSSAAARVRDDAGTGPLGEQRLTLYGVSWTEYLRLSRMFEGRPSVRLTYDDGALEIMTPSPAHEDFKKIVARLVEVWALVHDVSLTGLGSTTYRKKAKRGGLEPDECYVVGDVSRDDAHGRKHPDVALEVALTSGYVDKLSVYARLGVPEVWFWRRGALEIHVLEGAAYVRAPRSRVLPQLDLAELARFAKMPSQSDAVRAYHAHLARPARAKPVSKRRK